MLTTDQNYFHWNRGKNIWSYFSAGSSLQSISCYCKTVICSAKLCAVGKVQYFSTHSTTVWTLSVKLCSKNHFLPNYPVNAGSNNNDNLSLPGKHCMSGKNFPSCAACLMKVICEDWVTGTQIFPHVVMELRSIKRRWKIHYTQSSNGRIPLHLCPCHVTNLQIISVHVIKETCALKS